MNVAAMGNEKEIDAHNAEKHDEQKEEEYDKNNNVKKHEPPHWFVVSIKTYLAQFSLSFKLSLIYKYLSNCSFTVESF